MQKTAKEVRVKIADINFRLQCAKKRIKELNHNFYKGFVSENSGPIDIDLEVFPSPLPEYPKKRTIFNAMKNSWMLYEYGNKYVIEIFHPNRYRPKQSMILLNKNFITGKIWAKRLVLPKLMRPLGEILAINHLAGNKGVLAHALGVDDGGKGMVFFGASGAGKSTLANLYKKHSKNTVILSDERLILRKKENKFWLHGTPWPGGGFTTSNRSVELRKIFFIEHGRQNEVFCEPETLMINKLFQQLFLFFWDTKVLNSALLFCENLIHATRSYRLAFVPDRTIIDFVREV